MVGLGGISGLGGICGFAGISGLGGICGFDGSSGLGGGLLSGFGDSMRGDLEGSGGAALYKSAQLPTAFLNTNLKAASLFQPVMTSFTSSSGCIRRTSEVSRTS